MEHFEFSILLTENYYQRLKTAKKSGFLNIGRCWFDSQAVADKTIHITLEQNCIRIAYKTKKSEVQDSCFYNKVHSLIETADGIFLRLDQKGFLFLPITENRQDNEHLMEVLHFLSARCPYVHKYAQLGLPNVSLWKRVMFRLRPNQGVNLHFNSPHLLVLLIALCGFFVGTVFCSGFFYRREITKEEAVSLCAVYESCDPAVSRRKLRYIDLQFSDAEEQTIDGCCSNKSLVAKLEIIPSGTQMKLLLHPYTGDVMEIEVSGNLLLEFSDSMEWMRREDWGFLFLGIFMYVACVIAVIELFLKKK